VRPGDHALVLIPGPGQMTTAATTPPSASPAPEPRQQWWIHFFGSIPRDP
jgi:hypothetical protein